MDTKNSQIANFWMVGINYKRTDASVRGLYAVSNEQYEKILLNAPEYGISELFIISTCNRTEIYGFTEAAENLVELLCKQCIGDVDTLNKFGYLKNGEVALEHLFHVAAGLDSQILGDFEILGQIKNAIKFSKSHGFVGSTLERIINCVYQATKSIKTNTALSNGTISVSFAAVQYIKEFYTTVENKKIILLGTGKIGRTTCRNLVDYLGTKNITLINRTEETAIELAKELNLVSAPISDLESQINAADIVLVSTGAQVPVILREHLEGKGKKLVLDLSVPRNVDHNAATLENITLVDVDVLSKIKDETLQHRKAEVPKAIAIINEHITEFFEWLEMRKYAPILKEVKNKLKDIYIDPIFHSRNFPPTELQTAPVDDQIKKVVNTLAIKIKHERSIGCFFIQAINDFIAN